MMKMNGRDLEYRLQFEDLIMGISSRFINLSSEAVDDGIHDALALIGNFEKVDRSYVFQFHDDGVHYDNTHEWCAEGVEPHRERLQGLTVSDLPWVMSRIRRGETVYLPRVGELPGEAVAERQEFDRESIQSLINVPMTLSGRVVGLVGFDSVAQEKLWSEDSRALLKIVGDIFAGALHRMRADRLLRDANEQLETHVRERTADLELSRQKYRILVTTVSHEMRTPLTAIQGSLSALLSGVGGALPDRARSLVEIANRSSTRLIRLINDFLDLEKMAEGRAHFRLQDTELSPLLEQAVESIRSFAEPYDVKVQIGDLHHALVHADPDRVIQVITNLLSNAVKFSDAGGLVQANMMRDGKMIRVSVTNQGPGIPEEFRNQVFERFAQVPAAERKGSGLGLSISKSIIQHLGGAIGFRSEPGRETTFYFTLPIVRSL